MITSLENKTVKQLCRLHQKKYRSDSFLVTSPELIDEAFKKGYLKQLIYVDELPFDFDDTLQVSKEVLNKIAQSEDVSYVGVAGLIDEKDDYGNRVIILDQLQDPLNIGRIMEAAILFGFDSIILSDNCADIYNEKCVNCSKGAIFDLNISHKDLESEIARLREDGFRIYATGLSKETKTLGEITNEDRMVFVFGNEGSGVRKQIMDICDEIIKIDMRNIDSLNVAMAASIVLYRFRKVL